MQISFFEIPPQLILPLKTLSKILIREVQNQLLLSRITVRLLISLCSLLFFIQCVDVVFFFFFFFFCASFNFGEPRRVKATETPV